MERTGRMIGTTEDEQEEEEEFMNRGDDDSDEDRNDSVNTNHNNDDHNDNTYDNSSSFISFKPPRPYYTEYDSGEELVEKTLKDWVMIHSSSSKGSIELEVLLNENGVLVDSFLYPVNEVLKDQLQYRHSLLKMLVKCNEDDHEQVFTDMNIENNKTQRSYCCCHYFSDVTFIQALNNDDENNFVNTTWKDHLQASLECFQQVKKSTTTCTEKNPSTGSHSVVLYVSIEALKLSGVLHVLRIRSTRKTTTTKRFNTKSEFFICKFLTAFHSKVFDLFGIACIL